MSEKRPPNCGMLELTAILAATKGTTIEPAGIIRHCEFDDPQDNSSCGSYVGIVRQDDDSPNEVVRYSAMPCGHYEGNLEPLRSLCPYLAAQLAAGQVIPDSPKDI